MTLLKSFFCFLAALFSLQLIIAQSPNQHIKIVPAPITKAGKKVKQQMQGVLKVHPVNPRYFTDQSGRAIYLTGSHTWLNVLDGIGPSGKQTPEDNAFLDFISAHGHNFTRLWAFENDGFVFKEVTPNVYLRTGPGIASDKNPKYDLSQLNQAYFDRLRLRVSAAKDRGIYVAVVLFGHSGNLSGATFYKKENNINGIDGDPNADGYAIETRTLQNPAVTTLQDAYVKKVIETVNDFDNVMYEIACESGPETTEWQYHLIRLIRQHESKMPKQHLVGMSSDGGYVKGDDTERLFKSDADWICPGWNTDTSCIYITDPPAATGEKIILTDTDHLWGVGGDSKWVWKNFLRGLQPNYMDPYVEYDPGATLGCTQEQFDSARRAMGLTLKVANQISLASMVPHNELSSTTYCLADPGSTYLVYLPDGDKVTVDLSIAKGTMSVQWMKPTEEGIISGKKINGGKKQEFEAPFSGDAVLYITKKKPLIISTDFAGTSKKTAAEINKKDDGLHIAWKNNILTISGKNLPGEKMNILYLEAFCKTGSTNREWDSTTIPHTTALLSSEDNDKHIKLKTIVQPDIEVTHDIIAGKDEITFNLVLRNKGDKAADIDWFQPCIRVNEFTNRKQEDYISRCFIFTDAGVTTLDKTRRTEEGFYKGGQTYVPAGINLKDVNPRPISMDQPANGLIGCFSDDDKYLMATAWDHYQELFQGIFVCIHSDPRVGGLKAGEVKQLKGKIYFLKNDMEALLRRYQQDFAELRVR